MRTIFIDSDFQCHPADDGTRGAVMTSFFDGKCDAFLEGYRHIPQGKQRTAADGSVFRGEMTAPWRPFGELLAAQSQYEAMLAAMDKAYQEGVESA